MTDCVTDSPVCTASLTPAQARVWEAFHHLSGPGRRLVTCAEVARHLGISEYRVGYLAGVMERKGLVIPRPLRFRRRAEVQALRAAARETGVAGSAAASAYPAWDAGAGEANRPRDEVQEELARWRRTMRKRYGRRWRRVLRDAARGVGMAGMARAVGAVGTGEQGGGG